MFTAPLATLNIHKVGLIPLPVDFFTHNFKNGVKKYGNPVFIKGIIWHEVG
jgi:hypothetical protein